MSSYKGFDINKVKFNHKFLNIHIFKYLLYFLRKKYFILSKEKKNMKLIYVDKF